MRERPEQRPAEATSARGIPPTARASAPVAALALGTFTVGTAEYVLTGQLDLVARGLGTSGSVAGQLVTVFALAYGVMTPILVAALARRGRRSILLAGFAVFAATNLASFFLPGFWSFAAVRAVMAVAAGLIVVTSIASVGRIVPESATGRGIAAVQMGFTASLILGVPLGRVLAEAAGWRSVFLVMAALAAVSGLLVRTMLPPMPGRAAADPRAGLTLLGDRRVLVGLSVTLLWLGGYSVAYTYLTPYLLETTPAGHTAVTVVLFLFGLASLVGTHLGGRHADRHGHRSALMIGNALHVLVLAALPVATGSLWATGALLLLWSLSAWSSAAPQQLRISSIDPPSADVLIGLNQSTMQLAIAAGAAIGGALIPAIGIDRLPWAAVALVLTSGVLHVAASREPGRAAAGRPRDGLPAA